MTNKAVPSLTAGTLSSTGVLHFVDGDGNSRKMTLADLKTFINTDPTVVPSSVEYRGARVEKSATQSISNNTATILTWASAARNTDSIWSSGASTRLTVPTGVTKVIVAGNIDWAAGATGVRRVNFLKNGSGFSGGAADYRAAATSEFHRQNIVSDVLDVTAGDYFEMQVTHTQGSALNITNGNLTWFAMRIVQASL
jgi:hypothetical protein